MYNKIGFFGKINRVIEHLYNAITKDEKEIKSNIILLKVKYVVQQIEELEKMKKILLTEYEGVCGKPYKEE